MVEQQIAEYQVAPMGQKNVIAGRIVSAVKSKGRFLKKRNDGWWEEVMDSDATMKVLKTFRTVRALQSTTKTTTQKGVARPVEKENRKRAKVIENQKAALVPCLGPSRAPTDGDSVWGGM